MEHVESQMGWYPSTEGFLELLCSLFSSGGSPSDLGAGARTRTGCSAYVEYVIHYVLPRATGLFVNTPKLPFRTLLDQSRLVARCLQAVQACLIRYSFKVSTKGRSVQDLSNAGTILKVKDLAERVVVMDDNSLDSTQDFMTALVSSVPTRGTDATSLGTFGSPQNLSQSQLVSNTSPPIPAPKSAGFTILADLLSSAEGDLFKAIALVLEEHRGHNGIASMYGIEASKLAAAYSLFVETPPNFSSAMSGAKDRRHSSSRVNLLKPLNSRVDFMSWEEAVYWREQSIISAMNILCAAAVREELFYQAVTAVSTPLALIPILRFEKKNPYASRLKVLDVNPSRLTELIMHSAVSQKMLESTVGFIGYTASTDKHDIKIASSALSLVHFVHQSLPRHTSTQMICGGTGANAKTLAVAVARRLVASSERCGESIPDLQVVQLIMEWILSDLRKNENFGAAQSLSDVLMGLPSVNSNGLWRPGSITSFRGPKDCFDAILDLLDFNFIVGSSTAAFASNCFEILTRLCDLKNVSQQIDLTKVMYSSQRLRSLDFWRSQLHLLLQNKGPIGSILERVVAPDISGRNFGSEHVLHSLSWLLKGTSGELRLLVGSQGGSLVGFLPPHLKQCEDLLLMLFGSPHDLLANAITHLPLERPSLDDASSLPSREVMRSAIVRLPGSPEIVDGYDIVDESILASNLPEGDGRLLQWARRWNSSVSWDCAASHLSAAVRTLIGASLICCGKCFTSVSARDSFSGVLTTTPSTGLRADSLISLLVTILNRLQQRDDPSSAATSGTAARNLCWSALLVTEHMVALSRTDGQIVKADLLTIRDKIARAMASLGQMQSSDAFRFQECIAVLSSALVLVMDATPEASEVVNIDYAVFRQVSLILAKLSTASDESPEGRTPSAAALVARACLSSLFDLFGDDGDPNLPEESLVHAVLTNLSPQSRDTNVKCFLHLLETLDSNISTLLQKIVQVPFGGDILLNAGLVKALLAAAGNYASEEERLKFLSEEQNRAIEFGIPAYFQGHLELLRALMASEHLSQDHRRALPQHFSQIITNYQVVITRLFETFPEYSSVLQTFVECTMQATLLSDTNGLGSQVQAQTTLPLQPLSSLNNSKMIFRGSFVEKRIFLTTLHIANHPLPSHLLLPIHHALRKTETTNSSSVVTVAAPKQKSWWSNFDFQTQNNGQVFREWTDDMFRHAVSGFDIINAGFVLMKGNPNFTAAMEIDLVRGFCNCANIARMLESAVLEREADFMELSEAEPGLPLEDRKHFLSLLAKKSSMSVTLILATLLERCRCWRLEPQNFALHEQTAELSRLIRFALDDTQIERMVATLPTTKQGQDYVKDLAVALRQELL